MENSTVISLIAIGLTVIGFIFQYFGFISRLMERVTKLETKIELFWGVVQKQMIDIMHSPHTPELDLLLDELQDNCLNLEKAHKLKDLLSQQMTLDNGKKMAVIFLLARVEQIIFKLNGELKK